MIDGGSGTFARKLALSALRHFVRRMPTIPAYRKFGNVLSDKVTAARSERFGRFPMLDAAALNAAIERIVNNG